LRDLHDVDGVYTTTASRPEARKIDRISYDEMLELASWRRVMHSRSIEFARSTVYPSTCAARFRCAGHVDRRRAGRQAAGSTGHRGGPGQGRGRITIQGVPDRRRVHASFRTIAARNRGGHDRPERLDRGTTEISFTWPRPTSRDPPAAETAARAIKATGVTFDPDSPRSRRRLGMRTHTGALPHVRALLTPESISR